MHFYSSRDNSPDSSTVNGTKGPKQETTRDFRSPSVRVSLDWLCDDVTRILERAQAGDPTAADHLLPLVYEELRKLAAFRMANEAAGNTLQPTALVHEAWLRLVGHDNPKFAGRGHFFAAAAEPCAASSSTEPAQARAASRRRTGAGGY